MIDQTSDSKNIVPIVEKPLSTFEDQIIFGETNIEKWARILFPAYASNRKELREIFQHELGEVSTEHGESARRYIEIIPPGGNGKRYTTKSHDVLLGLMSLWEKKGRPRKPFVISLSELARESGYKSTNSKNLNYVKEHLHRLYSTETHFKACFDAKDGNERRLTKRLRFIDTYTSDDMVNKSGVVTFGEALVKLNDVIMDSLLAGNAIPTNLHQRLKIKKDDARAIYGVYDTYLASAFKERGTKAILEIRIEKLFKDFQLAEGQVRYKSSRQRQAERLSKHLSGAEMSIEGLYMNVSAMETSDGKSWKLRFQIVGSPIKKTKLSYINSDDDVEVMLSQAMKHMGSNQAVTLDSTRALKHTMKTTNLNIVYSAIGEFAEDINNGKEPRSRPAYLQGIIKRKFREAKQLALKA